MKLSIKVLLAAFLALAVGYYALAQVNFTGNIVVSGVAPTQNTDGSALTDLVSIKVYRKVGTGAYAVLSTLPFTTTGGAFSYNDNGLANGAYCYQATAVNSQAHESTFSNESCRTVLQLTPKAPTGLVAQ